MARKKKFKKTMWPKPAQFKEVGCQLGVTGPQIFKIRRTK